VQVGYQARADRYSYFTHVGLCIVLVYACKLLYESEAVGRRLLRMVGVVVATALAIQTSHQVATWRDLETLMDHALSVTERNAKAHFGKGLALHFRGEHEAAIEELNRALAISPDYKEVRQQIAIVRQQMRFERALER
jgi:tetratricopeptide (TPR) repeat protein